MRVAILGAGPAGLMAAHACVRNDLEPVIYSAERKPSHVNEDMFLQRPLPDLGLTPGAGISYIRKGTARGYAKKCYGTVYAETNWEKIELGSGGIWWLREIYDDLWKRYQGAVQPAPIDHHVAELIANNFSLTINTIPAPAVCSRSDHFFSDIPTWLVRHYKHDHDHRDPNYILWNGELDVPKWFRMSRLRGWYTWEYAKDPREFATEELSDQAPRIVSGKKVLGTSCDCHPKVHRVGRWARWQRGVLNHHPFEQTTAILASEGLGKGA